MGSAFHPSVVGHTARRCQHPVDEVKTETYSDLLSNVPSEWIDENLVERNANYLLSNQRRSVVLDDDPTGTQTVYGMPVLTSWSVDVLEKVFQSGDRVIFLSTNSRALTEPEAQEQLAEIMTNVLEAAGKTGVECDVISRSDSTLRGHFPLDIQGIETKFQQLGGIKMDGVLVIPAFPTGGRYTLNAVQWVDSNTGVVPVGETAYAKDATFGFTTSDIRVWMENKSRGEIRAADVGLLDLHTTRTGGPDAVANYLLQAPYYSVVDVVTDLDLDVIAGGLALAETAGKRFLVRSASSFIRARAGLAEQELLTRDTLGIRSGPGLIVVGSHVPTTTRQITKLVENENIHQFIIGVKELLNDPEPTIAFYAHAVDQQLRIGNHVLIATQRELITANDGEQSLKLSRSVSTRVAQIVASLSENLSFLIAKGGITSADVATLGLGLTKATVLGQLLPGVPVWRVDDAVRYKNLPYVIFPGNVGTENSLWEAFQVLASRS